MKKVIVLLVTLLFATNASGISGTHTPGPERIMWDCGSHC